MSKALAEILKWLAVIGMLVALIGVLAGLTTVVGFLIRLLTSAFLIGWQGAGNYVQP